MPLQRSTSLIVYGLLISVAPLGTSYLGQLIVKSFGRHGIGELLAWSMPLLILSIPIGSAMIVSGAVAKLVEYRARREAGLPTPESLATAACPNCGAAIEWNTTECPKCRALFGAGAAWKPLPAARPPSAASKTWLMLYLQAFLLFAILPLLLSFVIQPLIAVYHGLPSREQSIVGLFGMVLVVGPAGAVVDATAAALAVYAAYRFAPAWFQRLTPLRGALWGLLLGLVLTPLQWGQIPPIAVGPAGLSPLYPLTLMAPDVLCHGIFFAWAVTTLRKI